MLIASVIGLLCWVAQMPGSAAGIVDYDISQDWISGIAAKGANVSAQRAQGYLLRVWEGRKGAGKGNLCVQTRQLQRDRSCAPAEPMPPAIAPHLLPLRVTCGTAFPLQGCEIAPKPTGRPLPPIAQPTATSASVASIIAQGWLLSPIVYMHPLEWSLLSDPVKWLQRGPIYDPTVGHARRLAPTHLAGVQHSGLTASRPWRIVYTYI